MIAAYSPFEWLVVGLVGTMILLMFAWAIALTVSVIRERRQR